MDLSVLNQEDMNLLIALPFMVGVWMSKTETDQDEFDAEPEMQALERCLQSTAKNSGTHPLCSDIFAKTLAKKSSWSDWVLRSQNVISEIPHAVNLLNTHFQASDRLAYRDCIMDLARAVANAHTPLNDMEALTKHTGFFQTLFGKPKKLPSVIMSTQETEVFAKLEAAFSGLHA
jgi:hypothetical protein